MVKLNNKSMFIPGDQYKHIIDNDSVIDRLAVKIGDLLKAQKALPVPSVTAIAHAATVEPSDTEHSGIITLAAIETTIQEALFPLLSRLTNIEVQLHLALASVREVPSVPWTGSGNTSPTAKAWEEESAFEYFQQEENVGCIVIQSPFTSPITEGSATDGGPSSKTFYNKVNSHAINILDINNDGTSSIAAQTSIREEQETNNLLRPQ